MDQQPPNGRDERAKRQIAFVTECMKRLALIKGTELTEERIDGYVRSLIEFSEAALGYAFKRALNEIVFFPQVAEIRVFAEEYRKTPEHLAACEKRSQELAERYKTAALNGRQTKILPTILDLPEASVAALQRHPDFRRALRHTTMATARTIAVPTDVAERKGPEWEARIQEQALELKRRAEEHEER